MTILKYSEQVFQPVSHVSLLDYSVSSDCILYYNKYDSETQYVTILSITVVRVSV